MRRKENRINVFDVEDEKLSVCKKNCQKLQFSFKKVKNFSCKLRHIVEFFANFSLKRG